MTILDCYSGYSLMGFIKGKSEGGNEEIEMNRELENLFNSRANTLTTINRNSVKWLRTNGGVEYIGKEFLNWLIRRGIVLEVTTAYSPEFNVCAGRLNCTLLDMARTK